MIVNFIIGIVIFFVLIIISRIISERGLKALSTEEKANLLDSLSVHRKVYVIPVVVIVLVYLLLARSFPQIASRGIGFFLLALLLYVLVFNFLTYWKLKSIRIPSSYIRNFLLSRSISLAGMIAFFAVILIQPIQ